jgi:hypothetical protein
MIKKENTADITAGVSAYACRGEVPYPLVYRSLSTAKIRSVALPSQHGGTPHDL